MGKIIPRFIQQYQGEIIFRMFGEDRKAMQKFHDDYKDAQYVLRSVEPTKEELNIAYDYKNGAMPNELIKKYKIKSSGKLDYILRKVGKWSLTHKLSA